jgi:hypothetical protein
MNPSQIQQDFIIHQIHTVIQRNFIVIIALALAVSATLLLEVGLLLQT